MIILAAALLGMSVLPASSSVEQGRLVIHFLRRPVGEETYELTRDAAGSQVLHADFSYTERGSTVPLSATLRMRSDLTPVAFTSKGKSYRPFSVNASVVVDAGSNRASVRDGDVTRQVALPERYFTLSGYNPLSVQMMLLRYWLSHGRPAHLAQLPAAAPGTDVEIEEAGHDTVASAAGPVRLTRYSIRNVVWGQESVWLDDRLRIAAAATYAGGLPLEAIRAQYEAALPQLVHSADADRLKALEALSASVKPVAEGRYAIRAARLIDEVHADPIVDVTVLIDGGRIVAAGPTAQVVLPRGTRVIKAPGATLLPGLWEMHAHFAQVDYGPAYLAAGVTTARDLGGEFDFVTAERDLINQGRGLGPHLLLGCLVDGGGPKAFGIVQAETPEQGRAVVRRCKAAGFVQMKVYDYIKPDVLAAIATEAHSLGMSVTGHVPLGMTAQQGVLAGMDQINHFGSITQAARAADPSRPIRIDSPGVQEEIAFFRTHHTVIDPTQAWGELLGRPRDVDIASFEPGYAKAPYSLTSVIGSSGSAPGTTRWGLTPETASLLRALYRAGVPIVAGTDKALPAHSLHRELELYVKAGLTPAEVIRIATRGAAEAMGVEHEVGTIEPGKRADLILVEGDPLANFSDLRRVVRVVTNGRMYDPAPLWRSVGYQP